MEELEDKVKSVIRDIPDFPKEGIVFKDITTLLAEPVVSSEVLEALKVHAVEIGAEIIIGIDSRGFLYGNSIAVELGLPFVPIRKKGKLPGDTIEAAYELEYGEAILEIHKDAIKAGQKVLIHDDLLATGGTALAAAKLVEELGGEVAGVSFVINLSFLPGASKIEEITDNLFSIATY